MQLYLNLSGTDGIVKQNPAARPEPGRNGGAKMNRIGIVLVVVAGLVAAGLIALSAWQIPAPTVAVNKVIPDDKLPK